jgi:predicted naringenin-chalcone synthase
VNHPRILGVGTATPPDRLTQAQTFHAAGLQGERIRKIFLNSDIDCRHFYLQGALNRADIWGVMIALGPGMAVEVALLRW